MSMDRSTALGLGMLVSLASSSWLFGSGHWLSGSFFLVFSMICLLVVTGEDW